MLFVIASFSNAETLVQAIGSEEGGYVGIIGVEWQQTYAANNVSISVPFFFEPNNPVQPASSVQAYLTTSIGPGTTVADQVASSSTTVVPSAGPAVSYVVFSGLSLAPRTYYLTIDDSGTLVGTSRESVGWAGEPLTNASITTAAGFSNVEFYALNGYLSSSPYEPGDPVGPLVTFTASNVEELSALNVQISGDIVSSAPEPNALGLTLAGGVAVAGLGVFKRRLPLCFPSNR
jgi:hypothetical protein